MHSGSKTLRRPRTWPAARARPRRAAAGTRQSRRPGACRRPPARCTRARAARRPGWRRALRHSCLPEQPCRLAPWLLRRPRTWPAARARPRQAAAGTRPSRLLNSCRQPPARCRRARAARRPGWRRAAAPPAAPAAAAAPARRHTTGITAPEHLQGAWRGAASLAPPHTKPLACDDSSCAH